MKTSETISKIAPALLRAQKAITFAVKDSKNPQFKSTYADLSSVIDACKPALNDAGIFFVQMPAPSDTGTIALTTRLIHESGEWIESTATCPLQKNDPQGYGSANTYLRRYSLAAAVGLYQDDDDGNAASRKAPPPAVVPASFRSSPTMGEMEALPPDQQQYIRELAMNVLADDPLAAVKRIDAENLDDTQKMALWAQLDSKTRAAIKKAQQTMREPA